MNYFYIDESGSILNDSRVFIHGCILTDTPDLIRITLDQLKDELRDDLYFDKVIQNSNQFDFHAVEDHPDIRTAIYRKLITLNWRAYFVILKKSGTFFEEFKKNEEDEIINEPGIIIKDLYVPSNLIVPGTLISKTPYRNEHKPPNNIAPDMKYGFNGDINVISDKNKWILSLPLKELEDKMYKLLTNASMGAYEKVGIKFFERFIAKRGGIYDDDDLSKAIINTNEVKNKILLFGKIFENILKTNNKNPKYFDLEEKYRFVFSWKKGWSLIMGPTILLNDVSEVKYFLQSFSIKPTGEWEGTFYIETIDHFGLDDRDPNNEISLVDINIVKYQHIHEGFAAWWILQHKMAYKPFRVKLMFAVDLKGKI